MAEVRKRRREEPEARRAQILAAARRAFRTFGFQATTVDRISSEAGVSVGLLYRFFPSKSAIVRAIITEDVQAPLRGIEDALKAASARSGSLAELIGAQVLATPLDLADFALRLEIAAEVCRDAGLRAFVRARHVELDESLAGQAGGIAGDAASARALADRLNVAGAVATGLAFHAVLYADPPELDAELVRRLMAAVFEAGD